MYVVCVCACVCVCVHCVCTYMYIQTLYATDGSMEKLYGGGEGLVFKQCLQWLEADLDSLRVLGALAVGNFARSGRYLTALPDSGVYLTALPDSGRYLTALPDCGIYLTALPDSGRYLTALPDSGRYLLLYLQ